MQKYILKTLENYEIAREYYDTITNAFYARYNKDCSTTLSYGFVARARDGKKPQWVEVQIIATINNEKQQFDYDKLLQISKDIKPRKIFYTN